MEPHQSALYAGEVMHHRLRPREHRLRYRLFYLLLDLDELPLLDRSLRLFSCNRFNLFSLRLRDYALGEVGLRERIERHMSGAGLETGGPIRLLTMPRILGYAFNPLSIYFCHGRGGDLCAILYEVNNTFGQRHTYLVPIPERSAGTRRHVARKALYVSPFMDTDMRYYFSVLPPDRNLSVCITGADAQGPLLVARLNATRQPLTDRALLRAFFVYPFLTVKVIAVIHWEALKLWLKGIRLVARPAPPSHPVTLGHGDLSLPAESLPEARLPHGS